MTITPKIRRLVWERDGGICGLCGQPVDWADLDIDHIEARMDGGGDSMRNLRAAHEACNLRRGRQDTKVRGYRRGNPSPHALSLNLTLGERTEREIEWMRERTGLSRKSVIARAVARLVQAEGMPPSVIADVPESERWTRQRRATSPPPPAGDANG